MQLAQKLYEGIQLADGKAAGLITYPRTDGLHVRIFLPSTIPPYYFLLFLWQGSLVYLVASSLFFPINCFGIFIHSLMLPV